VSTKASPISDSSTSSPLAGSAFGALAALIWAGFPAITKMSMAENALDAWDVTALRFGVAGLLLLPLFARRRLGALHPLAALFLACGAGAPYVLLTAGGLAFAPGAWSHHAELHALARRWQPPVLKESLTGGRIGGALAIAAGLVTLGWTGQHHGSSWLGDAMFVLGGLFWASYTIGLRVWRVDALHATAIVGVLSMVLYLPGYAWLAGADLAGAPWREIVIQAVFQGALSAVVALLLYTRAVAILGAARGAVFAALVPAFSLLLAIPLLHETPTALQLVGVVFVTAGMVFALGLHDPAKWRSLPMRAAQR
jgi:drug/metabolite transporter (DMT)-like permease